MSLPILMIVSGGRNGSLFFQSLLDGHPEILQFPGICYLNDFLDTTTKNLSADSLADQFSAHFPELFSSSLNTLLGMDKLGDTLDHSFEVSRDSFRSHLSSVLPSNYTQAQLVEALHVAYGKASQHPSDAPKLIVIHIHHAHRLKTLAKHLQFTTFFIERDPLPSLQSEIEGWIQFLGNDTSLCQAAKSLNRKLLEPYRTLQYGQRVFTLRLEDIHTRHQAVMTRFCTHFNLSPNPCLSESTFLGLKWWGDQISGKPLNGLNPSFTNKLKPQGFYTWELRWLEHTMRLRLAHYGYPQRTAPGLHIGWSQVWALVPGYYDLVLAKKAYKGISKRPLISLLKRMRDLGLWVVFRVEIVFKLRAQAPLPDLFFGGPT